jgi:hypothetical protein
MASTGTTQGCRSEVAGARLQKVMKKKVCMETPGTQFRRDMQVLRSARHGEHRHSGKGRDANG